MASSSESKQKDASLHHLYHQSAPLFPAASGSESYLHNPPALFPAAAESEGAEGNNTTGSLNWLQNHSFSKDAAASYEKFFQASQKVIKVETDIKPEDSDSEATNVQPEAKRQKTHKKKEKAKKKKKKKKHSISSAETLLELERELIAQNSKKVFIEDVGLKPQHAFRVDRKPDQVQAVFKAVYHLHLARYMTRTDKQSLGSIPTHQPLSNKETRKRARASRYYSKKNVESFCSEEVCDLSCPRLVYKNEKFQTVIASYGEYIPLDISVNEVKTENCSEVDPLGIYSKATKAFIQRLPSHDDKMTVEAMASELNKPPTKESGSKYATRRTAEFNQQLRETPLNEDLWLEFIKFQDTASAKAWEYSSEDATSQPFKRRTEKDLYERKLSIFEKALAVNPNSLKLSVAKLQLCAGYCDFNKLKQEWKQLTFVHPNSMYVWQEYLLFIQSNFSSFTFPSVVKAYEKCLTTLGKFLDGSFKSHLPPPDLEGHMIDTIYQLCHFLRQTGHSERAIAIFQALIEFNCYTPTNLQPTMSSSDWMAFFEPFWDSGVPRFGEKGAMGWAAVMQNKQLSDITSLKADAACEELEEDLVKSKLSRNQTWVKIERIRETHHWLPWRANPNDENDDCDDPERAVLVDDVSSFLVRFHDPNSNIRLLNAFLVFLGIKLPLHPTTLCALSRCHDSTVLEVPSQVISSPKFYNYKFEKTNALPEVLNICDVFPFNTTILIENVIEQASKWLPPENQTHLMVMWMEHKRSLLSNVRHGSNVTTAKQLFKETRKCFKNLLKEEANRNNLALWFEYGKLELDGANLAEARKVLELILQSQPNGPLQMEDKYQAALLCKFYRLYSEVELEFESSGALTTADSFRKTLQIVTVLSTGEPYTAAVEVTPAFVLKARRCYQSAIKTASDDYKVNVQSAVKMSWLINIKPSLLVELVPCYALFQYITLGLHPAAVLYDGILDMISQLLRDTDDEFQKYQLKLDMELLYLSYVRLVLHHINTTPSSLKIVRTVLVRALHIFPNNSHLLQLLLDIESRSNIAGRLRKHFNHWLQVDQAPVIGVYAVLAELTRQQSLREFQLQVEKSLPLPVADLPTVTEMGINEKIKSVFERALGLAQGRHCPLLWRLYLKFQSLYLDAAEMFPDDLQEVLDIMTEKEIRIRAPIEEVDLLTGFVASNDVRDRAPDIPLSTDDASVEQNKPQAKLANASQETVSPIPEN